MFILKCKRCHSTSVKKVFCMKDQVVGDYWYSTKENYQSDIAARFEKTYSSKNYSFVDFGYLHSSCEECGNIV